MAEKFKRVILYRFNKYQKKLLYPLLLVAVLACLVTVVFMQFFLSSISFIDTQHFNYGEIRSWIGLATGVVVVTLVLLFAAIIWSCYITNKIVGPYERILRELAEAIKQKNKREL